ncbi:5-formyltetrahydrofolate cyclo-ligase [Sphingobacterium rhinopitheci]|uniref:5-formyltetrahydrofolate cyclo-ligase n=1 Tax=Sphingobacterium rhinopitheci TaxID=2781960 RepID=UPI001F52AA80|nr:5-formyltetrahydrofolate cyclo-ligase [Sphingobacterium rhinopitheci]MCI0921032.1 5-formyltetrahydrofolate cyclo-ligase [Sphingobacterium rhinopitheci]
MTKAEYRSIYKHKRLALPFSEKSKWDVLIYNQLITLPWVEARYVHVFIPIKKLKEPDTHLFVDYIRTNFPTCNIVISKSSFQDNSMTNYIWSSDLVLVENKWGIEEPYDGEIVNEEMIDVVLIPLLIADLNGNRIGYGKGFYDRFLSKCRTDVKKIGVCYFEPVQKIDDISTLDIPLDMLITPHNTYIYK